MTVRPVDDAGAPPGAPPVDAAGVVRPVDREALPVAWDTLARSLHDDPMFRWLLPDERDRAAWLPVFMAFGLHGSLPAGGALCPAQGEGAGVVALLPPGHPPLTARAIFGFLVRRLPRPDIPLPTAHFARGAHACLRVMDRVHPRDPHWYVFILGVHPDRKGQGLGGVLMRRVVELAERDRVPAYLETTNPVNLGFYARYGFEVADELTPLPGAPPIWTMLRRLS